MTQRDACSRSLNNICGWRSKKKIEIHIIIHPQSSSCVDAYTDTHTFARKHTTNTRGICWTRFLVIVIHGYKNRITYTSILNWREKKTTTSTRERESRTLIWENETTKNHRLRDEKKFPITRPTTITITTMRNAQRKWTQIEWEWEKKTEQSIDAKTDRERAHSKWKLQVSR